MDIDDLKLFRSVAKLGSFSKAGDEWNFVQSTVTAKMQKLEQHFKTALFHRHRYGVTLTSAGKHLLVYADQITHMFSEAEKTIIAPEVPSGPILLGSMETTAAIRLPPALSEYHKRYPDIDVTLRTGTSEALVKAVLGYELDGAFVAGPVHHPDMEQLNVCDEELVLFSNHPLPYKNDGVLDLRSSKLLVFREGCSYRIKLEDWLKAERLTPGTTMEFGSLEVILGCVYAGLGISLLPKSVLARADQQYALSFQELPETWGKVPTCFIHRKDVAPTLAVRKFLEMLDGVIKEEPVRESER
ncbi:LysR family transcriptional regulator [Paenibacillus allorhizosphaerae]|uniref:HTH-type transcriptional regulator GltR n=1 Tax=Paenibacillus allorhizosphaerae TaxID=2849866 RepID=A0ABN7TKW6_9BACL|nr:LysR family transcriptional regulator [Paenibacillus allorhizosphaerae]CAG7644574.1 HTH-type transcriptional regulator GltR [Paenibacillus allorhizosphaerae]